MKQLEGLSDIERSLSSEDQSDIFLCQKRKEMLTERFCLETFTEAHAKKQVKDPCYQCRQGAALRIRFAFDVYPSQRAINACLVMAKGKNIQPWVYRVLLSL